MGDEAHISTSKGGMVMIAVLAGSSAGNGLAA